MLGLQAAPRVFRRSLAGLRAMSTAAATPKVQVATEGKVKVVTLAAPPANALSFEVLSELSETLKTIETDASTGAIVLAGSDRLFSAGLDITEMYQPKEERFKLFWGAVQDTYLSFYGYKKAAVAAVTGAAPAGGCWLATMCDYRIMSSKGVIGLNETQLGIVAPTFISGPLLAAVGTRHTERMLQLGLLLPAAEAKSIGLVDEVVEPAEVLPAAIKEAQKWAAIPAQARHASKVSIRGPAIEALAAGKEADLWSTWDFITQPAVQANIGGYLQALAARKDKPKA